MTRLALYALLLTGCAKQVSLETHYDAGTPFQLADPQACITSPLFYVTYDGVTHIDCVVEDLSADGNTITEIPYCKPDTSQQTYPCWYEVDNSSTCQSICDPTTHELTSYGITINRTGVPLENGTTKITCDAIAADPSACN